MYAGNPTLTLHIQAILISNADNGGPLIFREPNAPCRACKWGAFIYLRDGDALLYSGIISICTVGYRYSPSLFIFRGSRVDAKRYWPVNPQHRLLGHVTRSDCLAAAAAPAPAQCLLSKASRAAGWVMVPCLACSLGDAHLVGVY